MNIHNISESGVHIQQRRLSTPPVTRLPFSNESNITNSDALESYLYKSAYLDGVCSDITVKSFGKTYRLHKLILWRSGFFKAMFESVKWMGDGNDGNTLTSANSLEIYDINLEEVDFITKESFEYVVSFLYFTSLDQHQQIYGNCINGNFSTKILDFLFSVIATASYLSIPSEFSNYHTLLILQSINESNIGHICQFATYHDYGTSITNKLLDSCRGWLCSYGWTCQNLQDDELNVWSSIPAEVIKDVVTSDLFFVANEFERCCFLTKILELRESRFTKDDSNELENIETLKQILNTPGLINYVHMTASQLHHLESLKNSKGVPYIRPEILKNALWDGFRLRKIVTSASPVQTSLGIASEGRYQQDSDSNELWIVPAKDETIYDTPLILKTRFRENNKLVPSENHKVSIYPPYRFAVHFTSEQLSNLPFEKRIYSQTIWYMGSYWNLYIQKIKTKKGTFQMGVYLHRASNVEHQVATTDITAKERFQRDFGMKSIARDLSDMNISENYDSDITQLVQGSFSESDYELEEEEKESINATPQSMDNDEDGCLRYVDPRTEIKTYYKIHTPTNFSSEESSKSKKKRSPSPFSITCFASTPDIFNKSQSWGWKSNSMCRFDAVGNVLPERSTDGRDGDGLRFMVCLGLV